MSPGKVVLCVVLFGAGPLSWVAVGASGDDAGSVILDTESTWRMHVTLRTPVIGPADNPQPRVELDTWADSEFPPPEWVKPEFDDGNWLRVRGRQFVAARASHRGGDEAAGRYGFGQRLTLALLCLRGSFWVDDPSRVKELVFSAQYRGGLMVYLNGCEVARHYMPRGAISPGTLAVSYPREAYFAPDGKPFDLEYYKYALRESSRGGEAGRTQWEEIKRRLELRVRRANNIRLPRSFLRRGMNVVALEIHRVSDHPDYKLDYRGYYGYMFPGWGSVGLCNVELRGSPGAAVIDTAHGDGLHIWNHSILQRVFKLDRADPNETPQVIRMVGTRNGAFAAQIVAGCKSPIGGLSAEVSDLEHSSEGLIPARSVQIRYLAPWPSLSEAERRRDTADLPLLFDILTHDPPDPVPVNEISGEAVQPIWITVNVPPGAPGGQYNGIVTIRARGVESVKVPIRVEVAGFRLPEPQQFSTFIDMIQSPLSVALQYQVPLWSDRHFQLMAESFKLMGQMGNKVIYVPLICHTFIHNRESMVRWIKQGDGTYRHDFSILEKYVDLALEHMGKPEVVCLWVWSHYLDYNRGKYETDDYENVGVLVSALDPETGRVQEMRGPAYGEVQAQEFWQPVIVGVQERLRKRGLEEAILLGVIGDRGPKKELMDCWKEVFPEARWKQVAHHTRPEHLDQPVVHRADAIFNLYGGYAGMVDVEKKKLYGWRRPWELMHCRSLEFYAPLTFGRTQAEVAIQSGYGGIGWMTGDFWPLPEMLGLPWGAGGASHGRTHFWRNPVLGIGPNGAVSTVRREVFREGMQEAEACIYIDKALSDGGSRAALGKELVEWCRGLLDLRAKRALWSCAGYHGRFHSVHSKYHTSLEVPRAGIYWHVSSDWQRYSGELFQTAAEVARALGKLE